MSDLVATFNTTRGPIRVRLTPSETPITVANFVNLVERGYYNGLAFHRVIPNFMIQGGCPEGSGRGGPGYRFDDEIAPGLRHGKGVLSMANAGPGTNGSQFFITHGPTPHLDGKHTVFGKVIDAADEKVVDAIQQGDKIDSIVLVGDTASVLSAESAQVAQWNKALDAR